MAVTSTIEYCTDRDLNDIYPHISEFDLKRRLYNFQSGLTDFYDTSLDIFYATNTGLVTELFIDGAKIDKITFPSETTQVKTAVTKSSTTVIVDDNTAFLSPDIIKVGSEYIPVDATTSSDTINCLAAKRGLFGTSAQIHAIDTSVYKVIDANTDLADATSSGQSYSFVYDSDLDLLLLIGDDLTSNNPNNSIIEAGDDWADIKQRFRRKASRLIESHLDSRISREILKDREGNYPEIIIHATALQTVLLLLKAHDPNNDVIAPFQEELNEILEGIKAGSIVLPHKVTADSSKGVIREVSTNTSTALRPVELKGNYHNWGYDLIKIKVYIDGGGSSSNGAIGTAKYSVWGKDSDSLQNHQVITNDIITGDYDPIISGLYIRFAGPSITSVAYENDEYEIEVHSSSIDVDTSQTGSIRMTRR